MPAVRDVVSHAPKPKPQRRRGAVADVLSTLRTMSATLNAVAANNTRIRDGLARLAPIMEARKAAKDAAMRDAARAERSTPAAVNAANAKRWARPGR